MNNSENRRLREKQKDIRNIRTTASTTASTPASTTASTTESTTAATTAFTTALSTALSSLTSVTTWSPPVELRRHQSSQKYKSAEANYLALRRNNNYKARQYSSTSPGMSTLAIDFYDKLRVY